MSGIDGEDMSSIGPMLGNIFGVNKKESDENAKSAASSDSSNSERKKVKTEKNYEFRL